MDGDIVQVTDESIDENLIVKYPGLSSIEEVTDRHTWQISHTWLQTMQDFSCCLQIYWGYFFTKFTKTEDMFIICFIVCNVRTTVGQFFFINCLQLRYTVIKSIRNSISLYRVSPTLSLNFYISYNPTILNWSIEGSWIAWENCWKLFISLSR